MILRDWKKILRKSTKPEEPSRKKSKHKSEKREKPKSKEEKSDMQTSKKDSSPADSSKETPKLWTNKLINNNIPTKRPKSMRKLSSTTPWHRWTTMITMSQKMTPNQDKNTTRIKRSIPTKSSKVSSQTMMHMLSPSP